MQDEQTNPTAETAPPTGDSGDEAALLKAISENPDTARALAAIATGADAAEVLRSLIPENTDDSGIPVSSTAFLGNGHTDFWDESFF